jgi:probable HAF family extracellular repeat protein
LIDCPIFIRQKVISLMIRSETHLPAMTKIQNSWLLSITFGMFVAFASTQQGVQAAEFIPLGTLNLTSFQSYATDVSDNGTVVGMSTSSVWDVLNGSWGSEAFRWTAQTGMVGLGDFPGGFFRSFATGVSSDGSVVVGRGSIEGNNEAFRWTSTAGMVGLGAIHATIVDSDASGVSADGSVVVGKSIAPGALPGQGSNHDEAFRRTNSDGMVGLGLLESGDSGSVANNVSADGRVVVGYSYNSESFTIKAFSWTEVGGMVGLGDLPGGDFESRATDVSEDGSFIVGSSHSASGREAFRWTSANGMVGLGDLPGGNFDSMATGVSADGSVVVGNSRTESGNEGFVWTLANGMQRLQDVLEANGTTGLDGWGPLTIESISSNGQWIVGTGTNPSGFKEAFLVQTDLDLIQGFKINAGLNDAWYNPDTSGQGFFITVFPNLGAVSLAWFTYDAVLPPNDATANLGDPGHRWLTAVGPIMGNQVLMDIEMTSGGLFDTATEILRTDPPGSDGTITLTFDNCSSGTVEYDIPSINRQGIVPIQRVATDNVMICEALSTN